MRHARPVACAYTHLDEHGEEFPEVDVWLQQLVQLKDVVLSIGICRARRPTPINILRRDWDIANTAAFKDDHIDRGTDGHDGVTAIACSIVRTLIIHRQQDPVVGIDIQVDALQVVQEGETELDIVGAGETASAQEDVMAMAFCDCENVGVWEEQVVDGQLRDGERVR